MIFCKNKETQRIQTRIFELETERDSLRDSVINLKDNVAQLKLKRKIEEEDIKHMVAMKEARLQLDFDKRVQKVDLEQQKAIGLIKDEYRDKLELRLNKEVESMKEMYGQILTRLPDISASFKLKKSD